MPQKEHTFHKLEVPTWITKLEHSTVFNLFYEVLGCIHSFTLLSAPHVAKMSVFPCSAHNTITRGHGIQLENL